MSFIKWVSKSLIYLLLVKFIKEYYLCGFNKLFRICICTLFTIILSIIILLFQLYLPYSMTIFYQSHFAQVKSL